MKNKIKNKKILLLVTLGISVIIYLELFSNILGDSGFSLSLGYEILISLASGIILVGLITFLKKKGIIKTKSKEQKKKEKAKLEEELNLFKKEVEGSNIKELVNIKEILEKKEEILQKKIRKIERSTINYQVWKFIKFGFFFFFINILYFGAMDGVFFTKESFSLAIEHIFKVISSSLSKAVILVSEAFKNLFIKLYLLGVGSIIIKYTYWVALIYWIVYLFIFKILLNGSYDTIKEFFIPFIMKLKKKKGGQA